MKVSVRASQVPGGIPLLRVTGPLLRGSVGTVGDGGGGGGDVSGGSSGGFGPFQTLLSQLQRKEALTGGASVRYLELSQKLQYLGSPGGSKMTTSGSFLRFLGFSGMLMGIPQIFSARSVVFLSICLSECLRLLDFCFGRGCGGGAVALFSGVVYPGAATAAVVVVGVCEVEVCFCGVLGCD